MSKTIRPLKEAQNELYKKQQELSEFVKANTNEQGEYTFDGDGIKAFNDRNAELDSLANEVEQARAIEEAQKRAEASMKSRREVVERSVPFSGEGGDGQPREAKSAELKSLGDYFIESEEYKSSWEMAGKGIIKYAVEYPGDAFKQAYPSTTATTLPYPAQLPGFVPYATRRPVVADLIPQSDSDQPAIVYLEQTDQDFQAAAVAEGDLKPQSSFAWERRTVPFEVIAHYTKMTNQAMEDTPQLRDYLNEIMTTGVLLAEENEILNGNGSSPQLQGFLTKSGVQTQAAGSDDVFTTFLKGVTKVRHTGHANPTGAVFHPNDWQDIMTTQDTQGRFIFGDPALIQQTRTIWGIPYIVTGAMPENTALLGDFQMFSRLYRKGGVRILIGTEGEDLKRNMQTMVVEIRDALTITRPAAFVIMSGI